MNSSMEYFLAVCEEKSISRAAKRVMVSQQDMSNHIRRLESKYGLLFERKPKFVLTPAGEAVLETCREIRLLENNLTRRLDEQKKNKTGLIRLGLHNARARILLPGAAEAFSREYPGVRLEIVHGDTTTFGDMLAHGDLHLFLGVNTAAQPGFSSRRIGEEPIYFAVSASLLETCLPAAKQLSSITAQELAAFPLIFSPEISNTQARVMEFLSENGLSVTPRITVGDFDLQLRLAARGLGGCFCPAMHLHFKEAEALLNRPASVLKKFTVTGLDAHNELTLVKNRRMYHPAYLDAFEEILAKEARDALGA